MQVVFTRSLDRRDVTLVTRDDGVRLSVPVFGKLEPIPHDLAHFVVEEELGLWNGFWGSVSEGAIFKGMQVLEGRQRPHARERSRQIQAANHTSILMSELLVEASLRAVRGEAPPDLYLYGVAEAMHSHSKAERLALLERMRLATEAMYQRWQAVAMGEPLIVVWSRCHLRRARSAS